MSMPKFPNVPDLDLEDAISQIISSIAMEELALSHIINAEGEKLQYVLGTLETQRGAVPITITLKDLLKINESIRDTLGAVSMNQMFLLGKLSAAVNALPKPKKD
ncbi:MAG: hypothetical protein FWD48_03235 [Oscillospiraceae bacterium]|nr:hypothetical protein [Oscillospiraceae bacterium]